MSDLLRRFAAIARANMNSWQGKTLLDAVAEPKDEDSNSGGGKAQSWKGFWKNEREKHSKGQSLFEPLSQAEEDLGVFGLSPPSSLDEVRSARNREVKKYHSDKFAGEPEKQSAATEIMQIYNAAYTRLKRHFLGSTD